MFHFFHTPTLSDPSLLGSTPYFLPYCFFQPNLNHICQRERKWWYVPPHDDRKALPGTDHTLCLARGHPFPYSALPAFQVEYITCTWLPRTRHTSPCQDRRGREHGKQMALPSVLNNSPPKRVRVQLKPTQANKAYLNLNQRYVGKRERNHCNHSSICSSTQE